MDCKFFQWLFPDGASSHREWQEVDKLFEKQKAEKIFAEIDNDLINRIDKATKEFRESQLRYIPCQMVYYDRIKTNKRKLSIVNSHIKLYALQIKMQFLERQLKFKVCSLKRNPIKKQSRQILHKIKTHLIKNKPFYVLERRYEDGSYRGGYYIHGNKNFIKYKESK